MPHIIVAVSDSVFPNLDLAREVLSQVRAELRLAENASPEGILRVARDADAALVTYAKITSEVIRQMPRCRIISRFGIGVDNVDVPAATGAGIVVTRVPDYCVDEVSDHTLALLLSLARKIPFSNSRTHAGRWEMAAVAPIHRLRGSVLGLIGFGKIPRVVAPKALAFGLKVLTCDPYVSPESAEAAGVKKVDFKELVRMSDFISIHTPLTAETTNLFDRNILALMKPTAYLINTARGPIVDESALAHALDSGQLAGAALDVLSQEPPLHSPLFGRDNVILTPHTGFYSVESLEELQIKAAEEVVRVLTGKAPRNPVNPEVLQQSREASALNADRQVSNRSQV